MQYLPDALFRVEYCEKSINVATYGLRADQYGIDI
jgi:hypothetical protein